MGVWTTATFWGGIWLNLINLVLHKPQTQWLRKAVLVYMCQWVSLSKGLILGFHRNIVCHGRKLEVPITRRRRKEKRPQVYNSALPRTLAVLEGFCSCWLELVPLLLSWISEYSELALRPFSMLFPGRCMQKSLQMFATATQGNGEETWSSCAYQCSRHQRH